MRELILIHVLLLAILTADQSGKSVYSLRTFSVVNCENCIAYVHYVL